MTIEQLTDVLENDTRRETLRKSVSGEMVRAEYSHRADFRNAAKRAFYFDLKALNDALTNYETSLFLNCEADEVARCADAVVAAYRVAEGETPTPAPPTRDVDVRSWRDAATLAELQRHLAEHAAKVAALTALPATPETKNEAPASTRVAPVSRDCESSAKHRQSPATRAPKTGRAAQMARFWAVVAEEGIKGSDGERRAFAAAYLGKPVRSFSDLTAEQIGRLADAVRRGEVENGFAIRMNAWEVAA